MVFGLDLPIRERGAHGAKDGGVSVVGGEVGQLVGIEAQVVEFLGGTRGEEVDLLGLGEFVLLEEAEELDVGGAAHDVGGRGERQIGVVVADVFVAFVAHSTAAVFVIVPILLGEDVFAEGFGGIGEEGMEIDSLESDAGLFDFCDGEEGLGEIDGADETLADRTGRDHSGPFHNERCADAAIVEGGFVAGKGAAVVAEEEDDGLLGESLGIEFIEDRADVAVEAGDFVVVALVVGPDRRGVGVVGRQLHFLGARAVLENGFMVGAMGIERGEPEEERAVGGSGLKKGEPIGTAALGVAIGGLGELAAFGGIAGGQLKAGFIGFEDFVETIAHGVAEVPFAGGTGPIAFFLELLDEGDLTFRDGPMELLGVGLVGVTSGDETGPGRAARRSREKGPLEAHPPVGEALEIGGHDGFVTKGREVVPSEIVGEDDDEVGQLLEFFETGDLFGRGGRRYFLVLAFASLRLGPRRGEDGKEQERNDESRERHAGMKQIL